MEIAFNVVLVIGLVLLNGFFVASEFALVSLRKSRVQELVDEGNKTARLVIEMVNDPNRFVSATQVGITISSLALGWVGEPAVAKVLEGPLHDLGLSDGAIHTISFIVAFSIITYMHVVIGEIAPKGLALSKSERVSFAIVRPINWFYQVMRPIIWGLNKSAEILLGWFGVAMVPGSAAHSEDELRILVSESRQGGVLDESEQEMLHNVFDFADKDVEDVMVPRPDVVALPIDQSPSELMQAIVEQPYTRYPVYRDTHDDVIGILHIRDLFKAAERVGKDKVKIESLLRPAHVVPESKLLGGMLTDFRRSKSHMALVVDEYGSLAGIVTLEDLLEEIVGEIDDEHDTPDVMIERIADHQIRVDGRYPLDVLNEEFDLSIPAGDYHTIGGFVFGLLGQQPHDGDVVRHARLRFEVTETDGPRIVTVDVTMLDRLEGEKPKPDADDDSSQGASSDHAGDTA